tara:strand:+ start:1378 stop:1803 length:426 start_codon:yes stop_codon:yes gene_type:complete
MEEICYKEDQLVAIAKNLIQQTNSKILCFYGSMGAGKTTLIKALVKELVGGDIGNSPTFGIVNEYRRKDGELVAFHFDFYRLNDEMEALDLGFEEYLDQNAWVFIEWPEKISKFLPKHANHIYLEVIDEMHRKLTLSKLPL